MARPKVDPIEDVFRRWMALDTEAQQRVADMVAGYRAADGAASGDTAPKQPRKQRSPRTGLPGVVIGAAKEIAQP